MRRGDLLVMRHPDERWGPQVGDPSATRGPPILTPNVRLRGMNRLSVRPPPGTPLLLLKTQGCFAYVLHDGAEYTVEMTWVKRA